MTKLKLCARQYGGEPDLVTPAATGNELALVTGAVEVFDNYVGSGYSLPTDGMREAVALFARLEGVLLDPVYSGKAAAGLIDLVRTGHFKAGSNVLFVHTGGSPTLFHYKPLPTGSTVWQGAASRL